MTVPVSRIGDVCTGHGSFPPRPLVEGTDDFVVGNSPASKVGDNLAPHGSPSPSPPHGGTVASGSSTYYIANQQIARIGDPVSCGSAMAQGEGTFVVG